MGSTSGKTKGKRYNAAYVPPKDCATHKRAMDGPSWTPTEQRRKNILMRQFMTGESCGGRGNTQAYQEGWSRIFGGDKNG